MPTTRCRTLESPINTDRSQTDDAQKISAYEQSRDQRIKENMERMQKLGIGDLSLQLKSAVSVARRRAPKNPTDLKSPQRSTPISQSGPIRRSSRLLNTTPVSYTEVQLSKKNVSLEDEGLLLENGSRPEVYTEEHEKLLGSNERSWTLFVDGCGSDGKRIYDPVKGKTCHQCRQKTLGHRTQCSECNMVQGQFCGDCLYMRYGEHVLEANENPNWICPVCRGICNCSLCRQAKGWPPTGALYRKILKLGFKSCAHYLIQTRRGDINLEVCREDTTSQVSAKRSLPFTDMEAVSMQSPGIQDSISGSVKPESEGKVYDDHQFKGERENETLNNSLDPSSDGAKRALPFSNREAPLEKVKVPDIDNEAIPLLFPEVEAGNCIPKLSEHEADDTTDEKVEDKEAAKEPDFADKEQVHVNITPECSSKLKRKKALVVEPSQDSIANRLKQRRLGRGKNHDDEPENNILAKKQLCLMDNKHGDIGAALGMVLVED